MNGRKSLNNYVMIVIDVTMTLLFTYNNLQRFGFEAEIILAMPTHKLPLQPCYNYSPQM